MQVQSIIDVLGWAAGETAAGAGEDAATAGVERAQHARK